MRIIAGTFRSRQLITPRGWNTRPTSDRLRETLFDVLAPRIEGAVFADLFAGTGAVGIEALSRGARQVYFAENAKPALAALRENLAALKIGAGALVNTSGALPLLRHLITRNVLLDVAFLDPPYSDAAAYKATFQLLAAQPVLSPDAVVIAEHSRRDRLAEMAGELRPYRRIEHGEAALTFFRRESGVQQAPDPSL